MTDTRRTWRTAWAYAQRGLVSAGKVARARRTVSIATLMVVTLVGIVLGLALGGRTITDVGPFHAELSLSPSLTGDTSIYIPPLGSLHFDSHDGPAQLTVALGALDQARVQAIIDEPAALTQVSETVADDVIDGVIRLGFGGLGAALLGAMMLAALVFRDTRRVAWAGGLSLAIMLAGLGTTAGTFRFSAIEEPRYEGLLVNAPALVGDVQRIADEWEEYAQNLQNMVANVSLLYTTVSTLPAFTPGEDMTRVLHVSDLHLNPHAWSVIGTVVEQYDIDFVIDTGDIVDWGTAQESVYVQNISDVGVPYVFVRGNHDSEAVTQAAVDAQPNSIVLDNDVVTVAGLTVAGIGDPRFTPDRSTDPFADDQDATRQRVIDSGVQLAETIRQYPGVVDIAAVHDPLAAGPLDGLVGRVLAGHQHNRDVRPLVDSADEADDTAQVGGTLLMVQGSTGGAGLRGLEGEHPMPLAMSVLYFDDQQELVAYDDIAVGGTGLSEVSLERSVLGQENPTDAEGSADPAGADPDADDQEQPGLLDLTPSPAD